MNYQRLNVGDEREIIIDWLEKNNLLKEFEDGNYRFNGINIIKFAYMRGFGDSEEYLKRKRELDRSVVECINQFRIIEKKILNYQNFIESAKDMD